MKQFKTESKKLLDLMINSIYTNKEIFLRELISNASDAIDKLYFKTLNEGNALPESEMNILLSYDKDARIIRVEDNGIGMSEQDLDTNLGTIAHSGSEAFKEEHAESQGQDIDIIGQFGVGFYSSFMVADKVRVISRAYGEKDAHIWTSDGVSGYELTDAGDAWPEGKEHGTIVELHLRPSTEEEDTDQFLSEWGLKDLVKRYSNYVRHPVQMMVEKSRQKPKPEDAPEDYQPEYETYSELDTINSMTPIWKKRKNEVEDSDYNEFYKSTFRDFADPQRVISFHAEGALSYDALLFIPSATPFDYFSKDFERGLALYSSNVMIQEKCSDLLPDYLGFVRGIVDSPDVTLNISRETLQQNSQLRAIAKRVEKKILDELSSMRNNDRDAYETFFKNFGRSLKFGIYQSYGMKAEELAPYLLFWSAKQQKLVTFDEYLEGTSQDQDKIYFASGDSQERLAKLPSVANALAHDVDVLLCTQDIDEFMFSAMHAYTPEVEGEKKHFELTNIAQAGLDFASDEEKKEAEEAQESSKDVISAIKDALGDKVSEVRISAGLGEVPARLASEGPVSLEMERVMSQGPDGASAPKATRVLELNAHHRAFDKLKDAQAQGDGDKIKLISSILLDQALLVEGLQVEDPVAFAQNISELL